MTMLFTAVTVLLAQHGEPHKGGHSHHRRHGNPEDLAAYVKRMEEPGRDAWQKPDEVIARLGLSNASVVCDIGAGPGYFALRLAKQARHVFAVDVEPQLLGVLRERLTAARVTNVTPILAQGDDPLLPDASCDVILVVDTFHHFPDGVAYLQRLKRALRPGGRVVNIDFHKRELPVGPQLGHKVSREDFLTSAKKAGLTLQAEHTFLPHQYFLILNPAP